VVVHWFTENVWTYFAAFSVFFYLCRDVTQPVFHQQVYHGIFPEIEYRIVTMYQYQLKTTRQTKQFDFKTLQTKHNVLKTL